MQVGAMAPFGATGRLGRPPRGEALLLRRSAAHDFERGSFARFAGRSLCVCTVLAVGAAGAIVGIGRDLDPVPAAQAAARPETLPPIPKPRLAAVPTPERAGEPVYTHARIDRVPLDFLFPDDPDLVEAIVAHARLNRPAPAGPSAAEPLSEPPQATVTATLAPLPPRRAILAVPASAPLAEPPRASAELEPVLEFGPMRVSRDLVEIIMRAARATSMDPALLMAIADKESSFATDVRARTSSATGLFQFIDRTWLTVVREFGARHGLAKEAGAIALVDGDPVVPDAAERARILDLRRDPLLATLLAAEMLKRDAARIGRTIGRELTQGETYLAHFLGPDDAERFLEKVEEQPKVAAAALLPKPARANRPIFFATRTGRKGRKIAQSLSVAAVHEKFEAMMQRRLDRYRNVQQVAQARP